MVVIARFSFPHEAQMAKSSLESANVRCVIADEHTINTQWLYSNAIGGVRLFVDEENVQLAQQILNTDFSQCLNDEISIEEKQGDICPVCGSDDLSPYTQGKRPAFVVFILLGFPLFFYKQGYKCNQCGVFSEKL
ncbi:putative signal transducing protein [Vibrio sagamiensis]|uniref:Phosphoenolpyruvate synthase n=1 Tax=Vibrio sagamiensis NBRC 104589 TaxID=1219064 RepID=A0A511QFV1_9VIBR|nr:DUF2007 domain-containing protein [Vibrio sagamiensis]PNQ53650.1 DUF2007 domain-containing protein [Vibrio agarivorans]GEM76179.1 phosphoenolpyruvate synthase [Vibrio sagamiensis NBRC 104589]